MRISSTQTLSTAAEPFFLSNGPTPIQKYSSRPGFHSATVYHT